MINHSLRSRILCVALVLVFGTLASACGGGGSSGGPGTNPALVATFTAGNSSPAANTMNLAPGASNGANFTILVQVTGINDFFGAGFRIEFDDTTAEFVSASVLSSFLDDNGDPVYFEDPPSLLSAGVLRVAATIQDVNNDPPGVDVSATATLIELNFRATGATSAPNAFDITNVEVQLCPTTNGACNMTTPATLSGGMMTATF